MFICRFSGREFICVETIRGPVLNQVEKAIVFKGTSKGCRCPSGPFHEHRSKSAGWERAHGTPIQWNWFHPATPRSRDLLIPQVWNCSERSGEKKGERRWKEGWKGEAEAVGDIGFTLLLRSICCHRWKHEFALFFFLFFFKTCYAIHSPSFYTQHSSWRAKKVLFDVLLSFINMLIKLALSEGCHRYGSISRIFNDACGMINNSH